MKIIVITGASSGFGALTARALAKAGHTVYAGMRATTGRKKRERGKAKKFAKENNVDLRTIELDVASQASVDAAIQKIVGENKRLDVVIHNAGHMVFGPAEAFTPEQLAELYNVNVLSTQRVNRAALPQLRKQKQGLLVWVGSSSSAGGTPPYLAPYFAAKAGMDALAVIYARELTRWGIETSIIVPGAFTGGTNHFANAGSPADKARAAEYEAGHPFWFQALGCVMGMDWHSSGITTSVLGALKRGLNPRTKELGVYVCGGRGKHSRTTPHELAAYSDMTGLAGGALIRASRLTAKIDNNAIADGFQLYLHTFVISSSGEWAVIQQ